MSQPVGIQPFYVELRSAPKLRGFNPLTVLAKDHHRYATATLSPYVHIYFCGLEMLSCRLSEPVGVLKVKTGCDGPFRRQ